jgi:hypothetical protein
LLGTIKLEITSGSDVTLPVSEDIRQIGGGEEDILQKRENFVMPLF